MSTIINAQNNQAQDLFNISYPTPRVPSLTSVGAEAVITFDTTNVNVDTAASVDGATGQITLSSTSTVYQITAQAEINSNTPVHLKLVRSATGEQVGVAVPIQKQLAVVLQPATAGDYEIVAYTDNALNFQYPNQIQNAQITVQDFASGGGGAGPQGPEGPQGPQGPGANQSLNTTDSVTFAGLNVDNISSTSTTNLILATNNQLSSDTPVLVLKNTGDERFSFEQTSGLGNIKLFSVSDGTTTNPNIQAYVPIVPNGITTLGTSGTPWVDSYLTNINLGTQILMTPQSSDPAPFGSTATGVVVLADGTTWDPAGYSATTPYVALYNGTAWVALG